MGLENIILLMLIVAANVVFFSRLYLMYRLINLGQGSLGFDRLGERIKDLLVKGFGQKLVLREPSGYGHLFIFWGFIVLSYGSAENLIDGLIPGQITLAFLGPVDSLMATLQDILALCALIAIVIALYRRLIVRPVRLKGDLHQTLDALFILGLIIVLIVAFYGMRVIEPKQAFTPVGDFLRASILGQEGGSIETHAGAFKIFGWIHNLVVLGFLAYIPYSKHLHIVTALPNLFFREPSIPGRIEKLDLEDEEAESYGITQITDYTKKELLDVMACTECGRCQEVCPAYVTGKPLNPKKVVLDLKDYLFEEGPGILKNREKEPPKALYGDTIEEEVLWACTTCRACEEACPVEIQPMTKLIGIRQSRVLMEGDFPKEAQGALRNVEVQSNPWGLSQDSRADWCKDLDVTTLADDSDVEYLYFVGCAGAYDQRYIKASRALVKILQKAGVKFGILGTEEMCTGDSARRIGNEYLAQTLASQNVETFNRYGVKKIITSCPHCFNTIKNEYPDFGGSYEVMHHSDLIQQLIEKGKIKPAAGKGDGEKITFHDSCYLARYNDIIESPRDILKATHGTDSVVEMPRNGRKGFCCGAGGGRMWMEETIGTPVNVDRSREAIGTGAKTVATACPFCLTMMADGMKKEQREDIEVKDIAEIVADSLE